MLRIMTYNVHAGVGMDNRRDLARIAKVIAQARPDIVCLQELDVHRVRSGKVDQAHDIAQRLAMTFHFNAAMTVAEERYGDAILTHLPMRLVKSGDLPTLPRVRGLETRGAVWVEIDAPGGSKLQVVNTHLGLVPAEQRVQARALLGEDWLSADGFRDPAILIGDFNATPRYAIYRAFAGALADCQHAWTARGGPKRTKPTFPSRMPMLRIDHAFVSPGVRVMAVSTPNDLLTRMASDHLPLVIDVELG